MVWIFIIFLILFLIFIFISTVISFITFIVAPLTFISDKIKFYYYTNKYRRTSVYQKVVLYYNKIQSLNTIDESIVNAFPKCLSNDFSFISLLLNKTVFNDNTLVLCKCNTHFYHYSHCSKCFEKGVVKVRKILFNKIGKSLLNDKEFILYLLRFNDFPFDLIPKKFYKDIDIMREIIARKPDMYKLLSKSNKQEISLIVSALKNDYNLFEFIPHNLKNNKKFIKELIINYDVEIEILNYVSDNIINDFDTMYLLYLKDFDTTIYMPDSFFDNKTYVLKLINGVENNFRKKIVYDYLSNRLKNDEDIKISIL